MVSNEKHCKVEINKSNHAIRSCMIKACPEVKIPPPMMTEINLFPATIRKQKPFRPPAASKYQMGTKILTTIYRVRNTKHRLVKHIITRTLWLHNIKGKGIKGRRLIFIISTLNIVISL